MDFRKLGLAALMGVLVPVIAKAVTLPAGPISFEMQVIENKFRAEGIAVADINKDGNPDAMVGDYWYAGPTWARHEIKTPVAADIATDKYSDAFSIWTEDFNADGYPDQLVMPLMMTPVRWYENPKGSTAKWTPHDVGFGYTNEHPVYLPLFQNDAKRYLVAGSGTTGVTRISYFSRKTDPNLPWTEVPVSANGVLSSTLYYHGLGVGDVNKDGRNDILEAHGWYEQTADPTKWTFHSHTFVPVNSAAPLNSEVGFMYAYDFNGDGLNDVLSSSSHGYGVWWFEQKAGDVWVKHDIDVSFSETHALHFEDMDNDGKPDLITGKRYFAHGGNDPGALTPAVLVWYKYTLSGNTPKFDKFVIKSDSSGVGTDFDVSDFNADGYKDIAVANKAGIRIYMQIKPTTANRYVIQKKAYPQNSSSIRLTAVNGRLINLGDQGNPGSLRIPGIAAGAIFTIPKN